MTQALLDIAGIRVGYPAPGGGTRVVVDTLSLALGAGEIGCLLGASGCGKTTVLRAVAGFEPVLEGSIDVQGQRVAAAGLSLPPEKRSVGMMFQDYALFPHMDVAANVAFGLRGRSRAAQRERVGEMLALVGLAERGGSYPHELSGGQQQRVALARALAPGPALLLLDEPFSNLDTDTRQQLAAELRGLLKASGATVLMVTHDQSEAFTMADRIGVMDQGRILQWDCAEALYRRPLDPFVAGFIGRGCVVPAVGRLEVPVCGQLEAGVQRGRGLGSALASPGKTDAVPWLALGAGSGLTWAVRPWLALSLRLAVVVPLRPARFEVRQPDGQPYPVHQGAPVAGRAALAGEWRFR